MIEIDAASHGGVDDARDLRERAFYAPVAGRYKIYIIDEAHMVTQQGFNALLKLVEEPPPHLKFIFATTEPEKVIATIRSRTHHYPFRLMPPSVMRDLTEEILNSEGVPFDPAVLPLVVRAGGGSARDTLSILDQLLAGSDEGGIRYDRAVSLLGYTDASLLDEIVDAFAAGDGAAVFRAVNRVIEGGHEPRRFATDMLDRFRDLIVLASVPDAIATGLLDAPPDRVEALTGQAERYGLAALTRAADIVSTGLDQMRGATSPRLLLELMCAQVLLPGAATDERSVLARLERLEAGAAARPAQRARRQRRDNAHIERSEVTPGPQPSPAPGGQQPRRRRPARSRSPPPSASGPARPAPASAPSAPAPAASQPQAPASAPRQAPSAPAPTPAAPTPASRSACACPARDRGSAGIGRDDRARRGDHRDAASGLAQRARGGQGQGAGGRDRHRQREPGLPRRGRADAPLPPPGRRQGVRQQPLRGPAEAGDQHDVRHQHRGPGRHRRRRRRRRRADGRDPLPSRLPRRPRRPRNRRPSRPTPAESAMPPVAYPAELRPPRMPDRLAALAAPRVRSGSTGFPSGDLPPLPPPPSPDDEEDFDPDDEDMSDSVAHDLTGMALVQRELGGQVIAEYDD